MNAVKNCLVVLAAAVALASCSADPTSDSAGKSPTIIANPGTLALQLGTADSVAVVLVSATDPLGGAVDVNFQVTVPGGAGFTAVIDSTYQPVTGGARPQKTTKINVHALAASDGNFTIQGTGGTIQIPVRIAPAPTGTAMNLANAAPAPGAVDTISAPSGVKFIGGLSITNNKGDSASARQGYGAAGIAAYNADSSQVSFVAAPKAHGHIKITMANRSTPALTYAVVSSDSILAATYDSANAAVTLSSATPAFGDTIVATAPAGFRWGGASAPTKPAVSSVTPQVVAFSSDSTQIKFFAAPKAHGRVFFPAMISAAASATFFPVSSADTIGVGAADSVVAMTFSSAAPGGLVPDTITLPLPYRFAAGFNPTATVGGTAVAVFAIDTSHHDSSTAVIIPTPSSAGVVKLTGVVHEAANKYSLTMKSSGTITAGAAPVVATFSPAAPAANVADTVRLSGAGTFRFRPTSTLSSNGAQALTVSRTLDSLTMVVMPTPSTNGPLTISNLYYSGAPAVNFKLSTAGSLTVGAAPDLGTDGDAGSDASDPTTDAGIYGFAAPNSVGQVVAFWDSASFHAADIIGDGGDGSQWYHVTVSTSGKYNVFVAWNQTDDIDLFFIDPTFSNFIFDAFTANPTESAGGAVTADAQPYLLDLVIFGAKTGAVGVAVTRTQ